MPEYSVYPITLLILNTTISSSAYLIDLFCHLPILHVVSIKASFTV